MRCVSNVIGSSIKNDKILVKNESKLNNSKIKLHSATRYKKVCLRLRMYFKQRNQCTISKTNPAKNDRNVTDPHVRSKSYYY